MSNSKSKYYIENSSRDSSKDDDSNDTDQGDVIRCICDDTSDDGFTIQCDKCEDWQHVSCVNINKDNIPEQYICDRCIKKSKRSIEPTNRRQVALDDDSKSIDKKKNLKKGTKRNNSASKKRVYPEDSDESEEPQYLPSQISRKKFTPLAKSVFKEKLVEDLLIEVHRQWIELNRPRSALGGKPNLELSKSVTPKGLESIVVMESNLLLPAIPKASVKPLRKSLRGSYFLQNQKAPSVEKGVFADIHIPEHRYLMEVTGELIRKSDYKSTVENHFSLLGIPLAHVFFYRSIDLCIDARYAGNDTRYIRRSCCPNSEIKSIILPNDSDDHTIHMGIYTSEEIDRGEEITIGWNWHRGLLLWQKNKEFLRKNHQVEIDASERKQLKKALKLITDEFGECACEDKDECLIETLKEELEKGESHQEDVIPTSIGSSTSSKKKRLSNSTKSRVNNSEGKKVESVTKKPIPRASDIFTSDEEDSSSLRNSVKEEPKKSLSTKPKSSLPSTPTATDTIDRGVSSVGSTPKSENEGDSDIGAKRLRPASNRDIKLPCKKKWLRQYMSQQQHLKSTLNQKPRSPTLVETKEGLSLASSSSQQKPPQKSQTELLPKQVENQIKPSKDEVKTEVKHQKENVVKHEIKQEPKYEDEPQEHAGCYENRIDPLMDQQELIDMEAEGELSDIASSESTLPLEDTPTISHQNAIKVEDETPVEDEPKSEQPESSNKTEEVKQAPRKLTLQEYLSMRRGNLPTPDEKPPNE